MAIQAMYTGLGLIARTRSLIDEPDEDDSNVTNTELLYFLNMAQLDISTRFPVAPYASGEILGSAFDSAKEYALSADILAIEHVRVNGVKISPATYNPYQDTAPIALGYYMRYNKLGIPSIQSADSVHVYGRSLLAELAATSETPALPAVYTNALINYCVAMCKLKDQDEQGSSFWLQAYERDLARANKASATVQVDVRRIRSVY